MTGHRKENHQHLKERFQDSLERAQARLSTIEEEAQKMVRDVVERSVASRKEIASLIARVNAAEVLENPKVKQWQGKAKHVGDELQHHLEDLRGRVMDFAGVASREQVADLAKDLERLSRKIDRAVAAKKKPSA